MKTLIIAIMLLFSVSICNATVREITDDDNFIYDVKTIIHPRTNIKINIITYCDNGFLWKLIDGEPAQLITHGGYPASCFKPMMKKIQGGIDG